MSDTARDQALAQVASICAMVDALDVDYDRLGELRDSAEENHKIVVSYAEKMSDWQANATATEELAELADLEEKAGECESEEDARERIQEDALSVEVRSDWCNPGEAVEAAEFRIVLCTGGPHVELIGDLGRGTPTSVRVLYRDWGDSGELFDFDHDKVLRYCVQFYFGD